MTPNSIDAEVVTRRLRIVKDSLSDLESIGAVTTDRYQNEPITRAAIERLLQVIVDVAIDINAHVSTARLLKAPTTGRESFSAMAEIGALTSELAERLAPSASMRNILVHRYADIDPAVVVAAVPKAITEFAEYVRAVSEYLRQPD